MTDRVYEIRWHGRGGHGAVTAARIIAEAAHRMGYRGVTAAPSFGAERRGVPVSALTRVSHRPIGMLSQVVTPDIVVVLDRTLLAYDDVTAGLKPDGWLIVNSPRLPADLGMDGRFNTATADATSVCRELGLVLAGLTLVNTAILGAFARATGLVSVEAVCAVLGARFSGRAAAANLAAVKRTHEITRLNGVH